MMNNCGFMELDNTTDSLISYFSNLVKKYGGINLAQGVPSIHPPKDLLDLLSKYSHLNIHQYAPSKGNAELLDYLDNAYKTSKNQSKILITNGATEAISLIYTYLSSLHSNSLNVATFSPAYESYIHLPRIFKHKLFSYSIDPQIYFDELAFSRFFIQNKINLLFLASPANPYGKTLSKDKIEFLIKLAEQNNAYIILDAVYSEFYFTDNKPFYPTDCISKNVFYINSFSKKFSITGWRLGYCLVHESHFTKLIYIHDYTGLSASSYLQYALASFVSNPASVDYIKMIRQTLLSNYLNSSRILKSAGFTCPEVDGGYFTWAKLPDSYKHNGLSFAKDLYLSKKIAVIPGIHFGDDWDRYIRINLAVDSSLLNSGLDELVQFADS